MANKSGWNTGYSRVTEKETSSRFSEEDIELAQQVQEKYGVPVSVTLGQYALESNYGKNPVNTHNYFSVKKNGKYRTYSSKEESFDAFGKLLSSKRYTSKTSGATNVKDYLQGVKDGGYATDPNYVSKVMSVIDSNNLEKYDSMPDTWSKSTKSYTSVGTVTSNSNSVGLKWWGDVVRVVIILLILAVGVILLATSVGGSFHAPDVSKIVKGGK